MGNCPDEKIIKIFASIYLSGLINSYSHKIQNPGYELGRLTEDIQNRVGFDCKVVLPPTHDTASAVMAVPTQEEHALYISSGTWSLMGTELKEADCSKVSMQHNMTNEGGYDYRFRYLKNIMGLWMIQSIRRELNGVSYAEGSKKTAAAQRQWARPPSKTMAPATSSKPMAARTAPPAKCPATRIS